MNGPAPHRPDADYGDRPLRDTLAWVLQSLEQPTSAAGDWIAVVPGGVCAATSTPLAALVAGLGRIVTVDDELCTVLVGAEADPADVDALRAHLATAHPDLEVEFHDGGQPLYPFLLGVE